MSGAEAGDGGGKVISGEKKDVGGEVEGRIEEGVEADEAAEADEEGYFGGETTNWGDGQIDKEDVDSPVAGEVGDVVDGIGVECEGSGAVEVQQPGEGDEAEEVDEALEEDDGGFRH